MKGEGNCQNNCIKESLAIALCEVLAIMVGIQKIRWGEAREMEIRGHRIGNSPTGYIITEP